MNIHFDQMGTKRFFEWLAAKIIELVLPVIKEAVELDRCDEELLTRKEISEKVFNCSVDTFDKNFRYAPGFPKITKFGEERYPKKLVEKWIHENTEF